MRKITLQIIIALFALQASLLTVKAQQGQWTWMQGNNYQGAATVWGTKGFFAPANTPGAIYEAEQWTDHQGYFWMADGTMNMWKYDPTINQWAWIKGPQNGSVVVYGTMGIPDTANQMGYRGQGIPTWVDTAGNLWIFGGRGIGANNVYGYQNDLWMYNIQTNEWTWEAGADTANNLGNYGIIHVEASTNLPPARGETSATWVDNDNNLWLFGGAYKLTDQSPAYVFNDLWKFDIATHNWVWESGQSTANNPAVYGTLGVPNSANVPSSRFAYATWKDCSENLWMFGGYYYVSIFGDTYMVNDMWRYNPTNSEWTWMSGTNQYNNRGNDSIRCYASDTNIPPGRFENRACWTRGGGTHFEFFGGWSHISLDSCYNDLWDYNVTTNKWTLMSGSVVPAASGQNGSYGTYQVSSPTNMPPSRAGSLGWQRGDTLWMFGGGNPYLFNFNDMWRFVPDTTCPVISNPGSPAVANFSAAPLSGCAPLTVTFSNSSSNGSQYVWYFGDGDSSTLSNPTHTYIDSGSYSVTLIAINSSPCGTYKDTLKFVNYIHVHAKAFVALTPNPVTGCSPLTVSFTDTARNNSSLLWNFGDGGTSTVSNPSHTYLKGTYTISLIAYNVFGCNDTAYYSSIYVDTIPTVSDSFFAVPLTGCKPLNVAFYNESVNGVHYLWNFGDLDTSTSKNPNHTYLDSGVYTVTLYTINDTSICGSVEDTSVKVEYIEVGSPVLVLSSFTSSPDSGCAPILVNFTNSSSNGNNYLWNFGNGETDTALNPKNILYYDSGTYHITLITYNNTARCQSPPDTLSVDIHVDSCFLYIPNVFSPNGDGKNDFFNLWAYGYSNYHLIIYDRWGLKIFESYNNEYLWNGRVNNTGGKCPDGTYYYIFSADDMGGQPFLSHGYITLIR